MKSENFELEEYNYYRELQYVKDTKKCSRCGGNVIFEWNILPESDITYTISCEQCGYIFDDKKNKKNLTSKKEKCYSKKERR